MFEEYHAAVRLLEGVIPSTHAPQQSYMHTNRGHAFFLERTHRLLRRLDNPHHGFRVIHIAGTSGKGSTSAMIYETLVRAGRRVGLCTSPFVTTSIENIQIDGSLIDPLLFVHATEVVMSEYEKIQREDAVYTPSYAELFFAIRLLCFQKQRCEWVVIETGCGGRFDFSNVFPSKEVAVITNIGRDHVRVLGDTLEQIAWHKAGIISNASAVFSSVQEPSIRAVLNHEASENSVTVQYIHPTRVYRTAMLGEHQQWNAALAAAVGAHLQIDDAAIAEGIAHSRLPARVELMQEHPRVIVDGAHSVPKMQALVRALEEQFRPWNRLHLIVAFKEDRDVHELLPPIASLVNTATITAFQLPGFGSSNPADIEREMQKLNPNTSVHINLDVRAAIADAIAHAVPDDLICVTGSLYLACFARKYWISEEAILRARSCFPVPSP